LQSQPTITAAVAAAQGWAPGEGEDTRRSSQPANLPYLVDNIFFFIGHKNVYRYRKDPDGFVGE
jgi:hypothetical protein